MTINQTLLSVGTDTQEGLFIESLLGDDPNDKTFVTYKQVQKMMDDNYEREWGHLDPKPKVTEQEEFWDYKSRIRKIVGP